MARRRTAIETKPTPPIEAAQTTAAQAASQAVSVPAFGRPPKKA
jgi:hypothetical protein